MGTILAAAVGMMNAALWRLAQVNGHLQCPDREVFFQPVADGPANDPSGIKIDNHCQEQPTLTRPDIGDVVSPFLIWPGRPKNLIQQIWRNIQVMCAVCGGPVFMGSEHLDSVLGTLNDPPCGERC